MLGGHTQDGNSGPGPAPTRGASGSTATLTYGHGNPLKPKNKRRSSWKERGAPVIPLSKRRKFKLKPGVEEERGDG